MTCDEDGNHDCDFGYDEREGDTPENFDYVAKELSMESYNFFYGWAEYYLEMAESGQDPCEAFFFTTPTNNDWADECLKAARDMIKYLYPLE